MTDLHHAPKADRDDFDWYPFLEDGEQVLWRGRPRDGAGWRCVLNDDRLWMLFVAGFAAVWAGVWLQDFWATFPVWGALAALLMVAGLLSLTLTQEGARLRAARYAVTDRRSLVVDVRSRNVMEVLHKDARPRRRETRCGTRIKIGYARQRGWRVSSGDDDDTRVKFQALDPETSPLDLLVKLSAQARPQSVDTLPWQPGFTR